MKNIFILSIFLLGSATSLNALFFCVPKEPLDYKVDESKRRGICTKACGGAQFFGGHIDQREGQRWGCGCTGSDDTEQCEYTYRG